MEHPTPKISVLKKVYLYVVSLISLGMVIVACVSLINLGLKAWIFTKADSTNYPIACPAVEMPAMPSGAQPVPCDQTAQNQQVHDQLIASREQEASRDIALLIVGLPVFFYHWRLVRKETD